MKIIGAVWYNAVGIVVAEFDLKNSIGGNLRRSFIGVAKGKSEAEDAKEIIDFGHTFPLKQAEELVGLK